ncbi:hypothetical protein SAMN04487785_11440 [Dyella jiangningensis]|uniref:hypothetical protein n=1 Tax=Dyella sp. AtDHG13 TaxID=1938897 RepID=UPI00088B0E64|nr:hypothetical protein [Dyella sp. AtDHG13]PXV54181.1 hypothetical protein BDW41_113134 [Dyella sp. AtDHG13]SDL05092.1 hypothetical protein SAMN04487785_11440 [Dyella jiangningensis]
MRSPKPWEIGEGGVGADCPHKKFRTLKNRQKSWSCTCGTCAICGFTLHSAVHMHAAGGKPGDAPYDHRFEPKERRNG